MRLRSEERTLSSSTCVFHRVGKRRGMMVVRSKREEGGCWRARSRARGARLRGLHGFTTSAAELESLFDGREQDETWHIKSVKRSRTTQLNAELSAWIGRRERRHKGRRRQATTTGSVRFAAAEESHFSRRGRRSALNRLAIPSLEAYFISCLALRRFHSFPLSILHFHLVFTYLVHLLVESQGKARQGVSEPRSLAPGTTEPPPRRGAYGRHG